MCAVVSLIIEELWNSIKLECDSMHIKVNQYINPPECDSKDFILIKKCHFILKVRT